MIRDVIGRLVRRLPPRSRDHDDRMYQENRGIEAQALVNDNVSIAACDVSVIRQHCREWDRLTDAEKAVTLQRVTQKHNVGHRDRRSNTTCIALDEYRVANLSEGKSADAKLANLAIGTGTTTPAYSNRDLNAREFVTDTTSFDAQGTDLVVRSFLDTSEGNDASGDLTEVGLLLEDGSLANHSLITAVSKSSSRAVTFEVTLSFSAA